MRCGPEMPIPHRLARRFAVSRRTKATLRGAGLANCACLLALLGSCHGGLADIHRRVQKPVCFNN